jgi:hypothetical protein
MDMLGSIKAIVIISRAYNRKSKFDFLQISLNFSLKSTIISGFIYSILSEVLAELRFQKNKQVFSISKYIN